jgi:peptidoglycan/LPS O-acetylase OafA/YrhL
MELPPASSRRHDLDALRAFAMLLGIALHAALSLTGGPWMVQDSHTSRVFQILTSAVHGFRMPLFFVLSGFFTALLWRRRGLRAVIAHRLRRVFLPLLLGTLTIVPVMFWLGAVAAGSGESRAEKGPPTLWKACAAGDHDLVRRLLDDGTDVNAPDPVLGVTPLSYAAIFGRDEVMKLLVQRGADVKRTNRDGGTALHGAAFLGRAGIVRELLKAGADAKRKNERGETALDATLADWGVTQFVAKIMKVPVEREVVMKGRSEVREMLGGDAKEARPRPVLALWLFLTQMPIFSHLWFLWFLCWMVAGFSVCAWIANRIGWKPATRRWVSSPLSDLWLVPLTLIPAWFMGRALPNFGPDTSSSLLPPLHLLAYYALFFGYGALYFDSQDHESRLGRRWWLTLPLALLVVYPAGLSLTYGSAKLRGMAILLQVIYVWMMSAAMMGLFRRFVTQEWPWIRYLSDASYWMYLAHLPLVIAAQLWVRDWPLAAAWKFLLVCGAVFALLLVSYEYLVRYTWIGALLNGQKHRHTLATQT